MSQFYDVNGVEVHISDRSIQVNGSLLPLYAMNVPELWDDRILLIEEEDKENILEMVSDHLKEVWGVFSKTPNLLKEALSDVTNKVTEIGVVMNHLPSRRPWMSADFPPAPPLDALLTAAQSRFFLARFEPGNYRFDSVPSGAYSFAWGGYGHATLHPDGSWTASIHEAGSHPTSRKNRWVVGTKGVEAPWIPKRGDLGHLEKMT